MQEQRDPKGQPIDANQYGSQGNEGQYGQGQYDSEGNPDSQGPQAKEIVPDQSGKQNNAVQQNNREQQAQEEQPVQKVQQSEQHTLNQQEG